MLEEPAAPTVVDSTKSTPAPVAATPAPATDSTAAK